MYEFDNKFELHRIGEKFNDGFHLPFVSEILDNTN